MLSTRGVRDSINPTGAHGRGSWLLSFFGIGYSAEGEKGPIALVIVPRPPSGPLCPRIYSGRLRPRAAAARRSVVLEPMCVWLNKTGSATMAHGGQ